MADEIDDLRARVEAARERLSSDAAFARKVELRLDDLVRIVEGSLARQGAELAAAQARIADLGADLARALARAEQALGEAARADRLALENGELRQMVMTLLTVIEGRQKSPLATVMQKLEENVSGLVATSETAVAPEAAAEPDGPTGRTMAPDEAPEAPPPADGRIEDLSEIALYDAADEVVEPGQNGRDPAAPDPANG